MLESMEFGSASKKVNYLITIGASNFIPRYVSKRKENTSLHRNLHINVYSNIINNNQKVEKI